MKMNEKTKQNIAGFILTCIVLACGWFCGYIVGKAKGEKETLDRCNNLLKDHEFFTHTKE